MARRKLETSVPGKRAGKSVKHMRDSQIDFSEIAELSDKQLKNMKRVGRPPQWRYYEAADCIKA